MQYLIDTNALLYYLYNNEKLSDKAKDVIFSAETNIFVSIASFWEIAIKSSIGKLEVKSSLSKIAATCENENIHILPISPQQLDHIKKLPVIHGDPFDRLIISQALEENMTIITSDKTIPQYSVNVCW